MLFSQNCEMLSMVSVVRILKFIGVSSPDRASIADVVLIIDNTGHGGNRFPVRHKYSRLRDLPRSAQAKFVHWRAKV